MKRPKRAKVQRKALTVFLTEKEVTKFNEKPDKVSVFLYPYDDRQYGGLVLLQCIQALRAQITAEIAGFTSPSPTGEAAAHHHRLALQVNRS